MKKTIQLILIGAVTSGAFGLVGCASDQPQTTSTTTTTEETSVQQPATQTMH